MKFTIIGFLLPLTLFAEPKNLSIQDVDFETIQVRADGNKLKDTVQVKVLWQRDQFNSIQKKDLKAEIRFYAGANKGSLPRIMKDERQYVTTRSDEFTLDADEACPKAGKYFAKIWLSIRNNDGKRSANEDYKNYEETYPYTCIDRAKIQQIRASTDFKLADPIDRYNYKQLNLLVDVSNDQFERVSKEKDKFEVRMYSYRDNKKYRIGKEKTYLITRPNRESFSFRIKELCGELDGVLENVFGKEVEVGCRITVIDGEGSRNPSWDEFSCPTEKFLCK